MQSSARKPYKKPILTKQGTLAPVKAGKGWPAIVRAG